MMAVVRRWLIGHPLATAQAVHERLTKPFHRHNCQRASAGHR